MDNEEQYILMRLQNKVNRQKRPINNWNMKPQKNVSIPILISQ